MEKIIQELLAKAEADIRSRAIKVFEDNIERVKTSLKVLVGNTGLTMTQDLLDPDFHALVKDLINGTIKRTPDTNMLACAIADDMLSGYIL